MSEPYIGQIMLFAGNFAPRGWAFCQGQIMAIATNTALFSILGTTYGGNGQTTFALPDLRGRVPVGQGQGPGLSNYVLGEQSGSETVTLIITEVPAHTHLLNCNNAGPTVDNPNNALPAPLVDSSGAQVTGYATTANGLMAPNAIQPAGGSQPHQNLQPFTVLNYIIALEGIYPSRN